MSYKYQIDNKNNEFHHKQGYFHNKNFVNIAFHKFDRQIYASTNPNKH